MREYLRVAAATPRVFPGDVKENAKSIVRLVAEAAEKGVEVLTFPGLSLVGCTAGDLAYRPDVLDACKEALELIAKAVPDGMLAVIGLPARCACGVSSAAAVVFGGGYVIASGTAGDEKVFDICNGVKVGVVIGDDFALCDPMAQRLVAHGANVILDLGSSCETAGSAAFRRDMVKAASSRLVAAYVYAGAGAGESPTDAVYAGHSIIAESGSVLAESERFLRESAMIVADVDTEYIDFARSRSESFRNDARGIPVPADCIAAPVALKPKSSLLRPIERNPFVPEDKAARAEICAETFAIQSAALAARLEAIPCKDVVIGLSGGLDSALALLVCVEAFDRLGLDRKGIHAYTMPGFGTTRRTKGNAHKLCKALGIDLETIDIVPTCRRHFRDLGRGEEPHDTTYENAQARVRTLVLMDKANQVGGFVVGTGDLSELALGWCTYNADHMSIYAVNAGVVKTLVREVAAWYGAKHPECAKPIGGILETPISPELLPANADGTIAQVTEDKVGPYCLHDFFLYHFIERGASKEKILRLARQAFDGAYDGPTIEKWLGVFIRRFHSQQFKRNCMSDGPKTGPVSLSPRGGWTMPSDSRPL